MDMVRVVNQMNDPDNIQYSIFLTGTARDTCHGL